MMTTPKRLHDFCGERIPRREKSFNITSLCRRHPEEKQELVAAENTKKGKTASPFSILKTIVSYHLIIGRS